MQNKSQLNGFAVTSLVTGIVGLPGCLIPIINWVSLVCGIVAIVFGIFSLKIAKECDTKTGKGMAGFVMGIITVGIVLFTKLVFYGILGMLTL